MYRALRPAVQFELNRLMDFLLPQLQKEDVQVMLGRNELKIAVQSYLPSVTEQELGEIQLLLSLFLKDFYGFTLVLLYKTEDEQIIFNGAIY
jgi:hypothetical protein